MNPQITVLSTADFHSSVWTNKQYMAVGLARRTNVTYIESMGLRAPTISRADIARVISRVTKDSGSKSLSSQSELPESLEIVSPQVLPFHKFGPIRYANQTLIRKRLLPKLKTGENSVLWTFSPLTYGLENHFSKVVYHSVDLLHTLPGVPESTLLTAEEFLLRRADHVLASSQGVAEHLRTVRTDVQLWQNVADVERFKVHQRSERERSVVFAGNITPTKIDFSLLRSVAELGEKLKLAGPVNIDGVAADRELDGLLKMPNVDYLGNLTLDELAEVFGQSRVGLIPYHQNDYTRGVFPLKVYEYMGAGLNVVSTPLASLVANPPEGVNIGSHDQFAALVEQAIDTWGPETADAQSARAAGHSWSGRIEQAWELITAPGAKLG
ncbi:glycosyltransferase [Rhodococcus rhodochrous]|uniref:glycosyltransferase n=1 Tax=Rhodococcus rhodochrous TaxID=1829 RepID=UPI0009B9C82E|nr:glycosyltransferase [Rhodococcus rhodochrous]MBF4478309.1 glycosyltransferase [Rhodococcus rhodochrous]MDO1486874.1 glycosyltransferase [Rhodococcus rhodochrous]SNV24879.1 Uncharacterized protein conserved in bacteria [Rhodococcus rhodochrous]